MARPRFARQYEILALFARNAFLEELIDFLRHGSFAATATLRFAWLEPEDSFVQMNVADT